MIKSNRNFNDKYIINYLKNLCFLLNTKRNMNLIKDYKAMAQLNKI